ncbi:hypothetical protein HDU93_001730, partial [Gonapodya sp. JEL0774]
MIEVVVVLESSETDVAGNFAVPPNDEVSWDDIVHIFNGARSTVVKKSIQANDLDKLTVFLSASKQDIIVTNNELMLILLKLVGSGLLAETVKHTPGTKGFVRQQRFVKATAKGKLLVDGTYLSS